MGVVIRQSIKGTVWNYLGVVLGAANIMWVFPYYLSPEEIGIYRVVIDLGTLFAVFAGLGTGNIADRFYVKVEEPFRNGFIVYVGLLSLIGFAAFTMVYLLFDDLFYQLFSRNAQVLKSYKFYVLALTFMFVLMNLYDSIFRVRLNIVSTVFFREVFLRFVVLLVTVALGIGLLSFHGMMSWVMISYVFTVLFLGVWYYGRFIRPYIFKPYWPDKKTLRSILSYAAVILVGGGSSVLISRIDVLMIAAMMSNGLEKVAVYALGFFIASVIEIPRRSISQIATPLIAEAWHKHDLLYIDDIYKRSAINQLLIGGGIFMMIWISIDDLIAIIPQSQLYVECKQVVFWVGMARLLNMVTGLSGEIILQSKYYLFNMLSVIVLVVLITFFNFLFIPMMGIEGAAMGTGLAILIYNLLKTGFLYFKLGMNPFSWAIVKVIVVGGLLGIPFLYLPHWGSGVLFVVLSIGLKSVFYLLLSIPILYVLGVSKEMNRLIDKGIRIVQSLLERKRN